MGKYLIYSIEDDKNISKIINATLTKQGYEVVSFYDGETFLEEFRKRKPNMILLDMMLPNIQGGELLKLIRSDASNDEIEIIIISANHMLMDKVQGLDEGADDYIEKPFDILELMSRVNAKVRRHNKTKTIKVNDVTLDIYKHEVYVSDKQVKLTTREFEILTILFENKGNVVKRDYILSKIWGTDIAIETRTIDMHINNLRKKLGDNNNSLIVTIYGMGYKVVEK